MTTRGLAQLNIVNTDVSVSEGAGSVTIQVALEQAEQR